MTDIALRDYLESKLEELDKRMDLHFKLNDTAILKAEQTMGARLDSMNEFRDALKDQTSRMATRIELGGLEDQVQEIRREKANLDGRFAVIATMISFAISVALGIVYWVVSHIAP
jgi:hypothetical protein